MTITSEQNPRLKALRRLHTKRGRAQAGVFSAEGEDLIAAAEHAGRPAIEGYRLAGTSIGDGHFVDVDEPALAAASTLGSGTRAIGVYEQRWSAEPIGPLCVYLHGLRDPGNVGAVLRAAHAFGASCVALGPDCADPHAPKAVRASMGTIFAVALARARDTAELPGARVALVAGAGEPLAEVSARIGEEPLTLLVGAEREGLPEEVVQACEHVAQIPILGESLNAAMAATVALYETTRSSSGAWLTSTGVQRTSTRVRPT
ncbi:MAG TPA: RNA methyltransferase [Solirubrobacteraceae bacterium]|nr:RNA methyltransferase [Solirubrobacteraceae bacterium]